MGEILTIEDALRRRAAARVLRQTFVFTNGCFDILHPGHVALLRQAGALGHYLLVGINSDRSVRALDKGSGRPAQDELARATVLSALSAVDGVVVFDEETPYELITSLQPDVLVKGADWAADAIVGRDVVEARGGRVVRIPIEGGHSTSALLERIRT